MEEGKVGDGGRTAGMGDCSQIKREREKDEWRTE